MPAALALEGITKKFGAVIANENVSFVAELGRIHALVGENGAGKTTLMSIAFGLVTPDDGQITAKGCAIKDHSPRRARELGLGMVHQHFALAPSMTVVENLLLGQDGFGLDRRSATRRLEAVTHAYGVDIDPEARVGGLPVALRQRVEIIKMLYHDADVLILDEPTSVLSPLETRELLRTLKRFRDLGKAVVFVSHKLPEVLAIADEITVMRRGRVVATLMSADATEERLAKLMVGVLPVKSSRRQTTQSADAALEVKGLTVPAIAGGHGLRDVSLAIGVGEIVGLAAVAGNGQRELVRAITGLARVEHGTIEMASREITHASVATRRHFGLAYMPEERLGEGINVHASVLDNLILGFHRRPEFRGRFRLRKAAARQLARTLVEKYGIRAENLSALAGTLSGGNLQRVIAAREMEHAPLVFIAEEPTSGLDIHGANFIRERLVNLRDEGAGILLLTSDLEELLELSDRVIVLYAGRVRGEMTPDRVTEDRLGALMLGAS